MVWTRVVALHLVKDELPGLEADQCVGESGDEVSLPGHWLAHGRCSVNTSGKNKV